MSVVGIKPESISSLGVFRLLTDAVEKSKIERSKKPRKCLFLDYSAAATLNGADTKVRGRVSEKRSGPSRRCARNASAALKKFVCLLQKTFSTASTHIGSLRRSKRVGSPRRRFQLEKRG
jgi:hypothetical protein